MYVERAPNQMPRLPRATAETVFPLVPTDAQRALLEAAERLIAVKGLGVADREITAAAGHANKSAIAYHFGTRELLLVAIWDWRGRVVNQRRSVLLAELDRRGATTDLEALAFAYIAPLAESLAEWYPSSWARFNEHELRYLPQQIVDFLHRRAAEFEHLDTPLVVLTRLFDLMRQATCNGEEPRASRRVSLVSRLVVGGFAAWERDVDAGRSTLSDLDEVATDLCGVTVAMLASP